MNITQTHMNIIRTTHKTHDNHMKARWPWEQYHLQKTLAVVVALLAVVVTVLTVVVTVLTVVVTVLAVVVTVLAVVVMVGVVAFVVV